MKMYFELIENHGTACIIGTQNKDIIFPPRLFEQLSRKEFTLTGSWMSYGAPYPGDDWSLTAYHLKTGALKIDEEFIYRRYYLSQASEAFQLFNKEQVDGKVLFIMPDKCLTEY